MPIKRAVDHTKEYLPTVPPLFIWLVRVCHFVSVQSRIRSSRSGITFFFHHDNTIASANAYTPSRMTRFYNPHHTSRGEANQIPFQRRTLLPFYHLFLFQKCPCKKYMTQPLMLQRHYWIKGQSKSHILSLALIFNKGSLPMIEQFTGCVAKAGINRCTSSYTFVGRHDPHRWFLFLSSILCLPMITPFLRVRFSNVLFTYSYPKSSFS